MASRQDRLGDGQVASDNGRALRTLALVAVAIGLLALTTAACVLTYSSVHDFALRAGISPSLAKIYPDIGDAMLVMAGCSVLALRAAGLLSKVYGWLCFILLLGVLAASSVVHEAGLNMPLRAAEITAAVFPWALVLVAFGLLLVLLRHVRRRRQSHRASSAPTDALVSSRLALEPPALEPPALEAGPSAAYEDAEGYDAAVYEGPSEYEGSESYEYGTLQATSQYPAVSPHEPDETDEPHEPDEPADEPAEAELGVVNPAVPHPRQATPPDDAAPQPHKAVIRPTEMQLRARTPRQPDPANTPAPAPEPPATKPAPPAAASIAEPPTSGFTGDTIPGGELNPAPTPDEARPNPPKLNRPRSSPTPPS